MVYCLMFIMVYSTEWAERLKAFALDYRKDGQDTYYQLLDLIRKACDGAFDIARQANCRNSKQGVAIKQVKELPWEYIFDCMRASGKDFIILPPEIVKSGFGIYLHANPSPLYGWYDEDLDAIHLFSYTGRYEEEEDTSPGYDGYGRYDTYYQIVEGWLSRNGIWIKEPATRFVSLHTM